jgi:hypothetical protein
MDIKKSNLQIPIFIPTDSRVDLRQSPSHILGGSTQIDPKKISKKNQSNLFLTK